MAFTEGKSSDELMRAQTVLWTHIFNHIDSMSLKCAVELGIPDAIHSHGKPITLSDLLSALSLSPAKAPHLQRLMRMLIHSGIFAQNNNGGDDNEEDAYSLTPVSSLLVKSNDSTTGLSVLVAAVLHPVIVNPFQSMSAWFKSDEPTPFSVEHGCGLWEVTGRDPEFNKLFNEGMASDAKFLMNILLRDCGDVFQGIESLVDVGGGTGSAAIVISEAFPNVKCSVLELPHVVSTIKEKRDVDFIAGDMFDSIPPADAIFLKVRYPPPLSKLFSPP